MVPGLGGSEHHPGGCRALPADGARLLRSPSRARCSLGTEQRDNGLFIMETCPFEWIYRQLCAAPDRPVFFVFSPLLILIHRWYMSEQGCKRRSQGHGGAKARGIESSCQAAFLPGV